MTDASKSKGLLRALRALLPTSAQVLIHERNWHSLTFSGVQVCISAKVSDDDASIISEILPEYQFDLKGQLVADIAVIQTGFGPGQNQFLIDALLLDD